MPALFANPLFLWLLPLAGLPVLFHLFFRVRKRPRPFPSLMFFHRLDPRLSARKQIKEWLVLALRVLLLLLLLLALARPRWFSGWGGGSLAVVLVIDNSGSMNRPTGSAQPAPLAGALEAANALLGALESHDTAALVLLVDDPTITLPAALSTDKSALRVALNRIVPTEATGAVGDALRRAFAVLDQAGATRHEIHVFTDLHEAEWKRTAPAWPAHRAANIVLHRLSAPLAPVGNIALAQLELPDKRLLAGRPVPLRVHLQNPSRFPARARLLVTDDTGRQQTHELGLEPGADHTLTLLLAGAAPGVHWAQLWLEGDGFAADNRAGLAYVCAEKAAVLFVGGPAEFGLLPVALAPAADGRLSGLVPVFVNPAQLSAAIAEHNPLLVVQPASLPVPEAFVAGGGNLLLVPEPGAALQLSKEGLSVLVFDKTAPLFRELRDDKGDLPVRALKAFRFLPQPAGVDTVALLGLEDGRALLTEQRLGRGRVFRSGLPFDPGASTLPLKGAFLALAQNMALLGSDTGGTVQRLVAGQRLSLPADARPLHIRSVAGSPLDWKGPAAQAPVLPRAGVYALETEPGPGPGSTGTAQYVSVQAAAAEGRWQFVDGQPPALAGLDCTVRNYTAPESLRAEFRVVSRGVDLYLPLLLLALAALLVETWLANAPARAAQPKARPAPGAAP